jgi:hypothetical protein
MLDEDGRNDVQSGLASHSQPSCVTLVYLVPEAILSTRLLSPRGFYGGDLVQ